MQCNGEDDQLKSCFFPVYCHSHMKRQKLGSNPTSLAHCSSLAQEQNCYTCPLASHKHSFTLHVGIFASSFLLSFCLFCHSVPFHAPYSAIWLCTAFCLCFAFTLPVFINRIGFTSAWTSIFPCLLLPFTGCSIYIYWPQSDSSWKWAVSISQTLPVVWKESCFSLTLSLLLSLRKAAFLYFVPHCSPGIFLTQMSKQTEQEP